MHIAYPAPAPHGHIQQLLPDFFVVQGTVRIGPGATLHRNMGIVRSADELLLVNPFRLRKREEERLCDLGRVRQVVRLDAERGFDDLYYRDRFNVFLWRQPQSGRSLLPPADAELCDGGPCPLSGGRVFAFRHSRLPEVALLLPLNGGLLLTSEALQYWPNWEGCSWAAKWLLRFSGVHHGMQIPPYWRRRAANGTSERGMLLEDFTRLLQLPFYHLLGARGAFCADTAHELVARAVTAAFPRATSPTSAASQPTPEQGPKHAQDGRMLSEGSEAGEDKAQPVVAPLLPPRRPRGRRARYPGRLSGPYAHRDTDRPSVDQSVDNPAGQAGRGKC